MFFLHNTLESKQIITGECKGENYIININTRNAIFIEMHDRID